MAEEDRSTYRMLWVSFPTNLGCSLQALDEEGQQEADDL
jgi:hypothetical protein